MHEYTLAQNIMKIITEYSSTHNGYQATEVVIEIGELSGVMIDALKAAVDVLVKNSEFACTEFIYSEKKAKAQCTQCGHEVAVSDFISTCSQCHSSRLDIIEGKELCVKSIAFE
ncbi:hydrogenase maturation nickel metallochaperone HypA [Marinilabiliaceae bacterium JC017]|nr:hydrogenase maturation nickel metallochaperone HypA [Marinilabiliaceae bacterium JC017]